MLGLPRARIPGGSPPAEQGLRYPVIQRQLGHSNLGITSVYLQGIDNAEIVETVHARRAPMVPVSASLRL
jgi:integrase